MVSGAKALNMKGINPNTFIGRYGQRRLPAAHKWLFDRQGIHCLVGLLYAALIGIGWWFDVWELVVLCVVGAYVFLRYEETEDESINDYAYVDIGGFLVGLSVGGVGLAIAAIVRGVLSG